MEVLIKTFFLFDVDTFGEYEYVDINSLSEVVSDKDLSSELESNAGKIEIFCDGQDLKIKLENLEYLFRSLLSDAEDILENRPFSISLMLSELETLYGFPVNDELFALERTLDEED